MKNYLGVCKKWSIGFNFVWEEFSKERLACRATIPGLSWKLLGCVSCAVFRKLLCEKLTSVIRGSGTNGSSSENICAMAKLSNKSFASFASFFVDIMIISILLSCR